MQYYIDVLKNENIDYELISWNKKDIEEECDHVFKYITEDRNRKKILWGHFRFSRYVKHIISQKKYTNLVVFTVAPMFFLASVLARKYRARFIADIRDASPFVKAFPQKFKKITSMAKKIIVSSPNFADWIPHEVNMCHNCSLEMLREHKNDVISHDVALPIKIACAGSMNEGDINIRFIDAAQNAHLFHHWYIGRESSEKQKIMNHVAEMNDTNVSFIGTYQKEEIVSIYHETADFVNIIRSESKINSDALPNKLYDAVISGKPVIVLEHNTAIVKLVSKYHLGVVVTQDELDHPEELLIPRLTQFSFDDYADGRSAFIDDIMEEQMKFNGMIKELR